MVLFAGYSWSSSSILVAWLSSLVWLGLIRRFCLFFFFGRVSSSPGLLGHLHRFCWVLSIAFGISFGYSPLVGLPGLLLRFSSIWLVLVVRFVGFTWRCSWDASLVLRIPLQEVFVGFAWPVSSLSSVFFTGFLFWFGRYSSSIVAVLLRRVPLGVLIAFAWASSSVLLGHLLRVGLVFFIPSACTSSSVS
jgi:hypothetical protein